jgi:uncharacterized ion transporter superfamily protein YfcC
MGGAGKASRRLPHPLLLLLGAVVLAAAATWIVPAGEYERRDDPVTGRRLVVPGTYHAVEAAPVGPFAAVVAVPRGFVDAADVVAAILLVGGAWVVVDRIGTLSRVVGALVARFRRRGLWAIPVIASFFGAMGALENMQEEIIPMVPVLLLLGAGLGVDAVTVVAMSAGAAMVGSAFGPTNPFQAGIAMKIAELPVGTNLAPRVLMLVVAFALWVAWTMRWARRTRAALGAERAGGEPAGVERAVAPRTVPSGVETPLAARDLLILTVALAPLFVYVVGAMRWGWGFNELTAGFVIAAFAAGLLGGLDLASTVTVYLEGMQALLPAAMMVGVARSITLVLADARVIDTILATLAAPLDDAPAQLGALLMIPLHAVVHVLVSSVSGHAVLTMPILVPLSDLLAIPRQATVIAYQMGAGLTDALTPTNGALMAILLAAGVPFGRWLRFAIGGIALALAIGVVAIVAFT